jgi:hypothetical protein
VWIAHDRGGYDFSSAAEHGETRTVFKGEFNPFDLHSARQQAAETMRDAGPNDWIIMVGSSLASTIVAWTYLAQWDRLPVLVLHAQRRVYVKRELTGLLADINLKTR